MSILASDSSADLLLMNLEGIAIAHVELNEECQSCLFIWKGQVCRNGATHRFGCIIATDSRAIEEESDSRSFFTLTLTECLHQLVQASRSLDFEEDFVVAICDFDIEVLSTRCRLGLGTVGGLTAVGHDEVSGIE